MQGDQTASLEEGGGYGRRSVAPAWNPVLTVNPEAWKAKVANALESGRDGLYWVCDFDRTVTRCFLDNGERSLDCHDILASIPKITHHCKTCMEEMMEYYYPIEIHPTMTREEKIPYMVEWYTKVNFLLQDQNLTRADVAHAVKSCKSFKLRDGVEEAFGLAYTKGIPLIIVSAGLGNVIEEVIRQRIRMPVQTDVEGGANHDASSNDWPNVRVLSNTILWDEDGHQCGFSEPLIHMYNKSLQDAPDTIKTMLEGRKVGLLSGDSTGDLTMAHGIDSTDVLRVGFLNEKVEERLPKYIGRDCYDRVVLNDGNWETLLEILRKI